MPYIGRDLNRGNYLKLDDISSSFDSSTTTFNLTVGGSAFTPGSAFSILVSVGGVIQEPESAYQVNNSEITFANAPTAQDSFFCIALGVSLGIGVPGNGTVNGPQMAKPFNYDGFFYLDDANNRVGINSSSPTVALDVSGTIKGSTFSGPISNPSGISTFYDVRVINNLTVEGTTTTLDTDLIGVDRVEVAANSNSIVGVAITQSGTADIINLFDGTTEVLTVTDGGKVGIGSAIPAQILDIMSANPVIRLTDTDPAGVYSQIDGAGGDLILAADGGGGSSNSFISFRTDGTALSAEKVRITTDGNLKLPDNAKIELGGGQTGSGDFKIYHNGTTNVLAGFTASDINIESYFGADVNIITNSNHYAIKCISNAQVELYHDNNVRLTTTDDGITVDKGVTINGIEGGDAQIRLRADQGDDNNDMFRFVVSDGGTGLKIQGYDGSFQTRVTVDTNGRLLLNNISSRSIANVTAKVQLEGTSADGSAISITRNSANASPPYLNFGKSRATSTGGTTIIQDGDNLGEIRFSGADGNDLTNHAASINVEVDGTPGNNDTPGRLIFSTTSDGSSDATERLRIGSGGGLKLSNTSGGHLLEYGSSSVNTVAAIDINRNGTGYADIRLASNYGVALRLAGASNNTDEYNISQDNQKNAYHTLEYDGFINFATNTSTRAMRLDSGSVLFSGLTDKNDPRNDKGISIKSPNGISFQNFGANGSKNWRIRPDDLTGWGTLEFSVSPTVNDNTDWPDSASDVVLSLEPNKDVIVRNGKLGIGEGDPDGNQLIIRAASTVGTKNGHIMLTGDSATVDQGPQIVFSESGSGSNWVGGAIGFTRTGGNGVGDLIFGVRAVSGDANTTAKEALRILSGGNIRQTQTGANVNLTLSRNESVTNNNEALGVIDFASNTAHTVQARLMAKSRGTSNVGGDLIVEARASGGSLDERVRITGDGDVAIGRDAALANYSDGSTTTTQLAVVKDGGGAGSGYHEVAHFAGGTDSNDTGAIVRIGHFNNDRGMFIKAGRGTSDQAKAIIGLRNSSATEGNWITLTQNIDQITCHKSVDIDNGVNLSLGGTSGTHAPLHVKSENTGYGKNAVFGAKGWVNHANYHYTDATISLLGRDRDDNDKGVGIEFSARNTGDSNWLHGALTMGQDGHVRIFTGGAGTTQGAERLRIRSDGAMSAKRSAGAALELLRNTATTGTTDKLGELIFGSADWDSSTASIISYQDGAKDKGSLTFHTQAAVGPGIKERLRITSDGVIHHANDSDDMTWSRQTGRAQQGNGNATTYTIKTFYYGIATFKIALSDGNNKWAHFVVEIGGMQYSVSNGYNATIVANSTGNGPSISTNQQDGGYHITITNGGNGNTLFGSWVLEGTSYTDKSTPTLVTS